MFTGEGFSLISGFKFLFCSQEMDSVLIQVSRKCYVHQRNLYRCFFFCLEPANLIRFSFVMAFYNGILNNNCLREGPASQPQSTPSCWKNFPLLIQNSDPLLNLVPKKTVSFIHSCQNYFDTWCHNCMVWSSFDCLCPETA